jgi:hypothetical protein
LKAHANAQANAAAGDVVEKIVVVIIDFQAAIAELRRQSLK